MYLGQNRVPRLSRHPGGRRTAVLGQAPPLTLHDCVINGRKPGVAERSKCCVRACPDGLTRAAVPAQPYQAAQAFNNDIECKAADDLAVADSRRGPNAEALALFSGAAGDGTRAGCGAVRSQGRARSHDVASDPDWRTGPC